jgi:outer membrane receptor for ferrienterochelin and colicin
MSRTTTKRSFRAAIILGATCAALSAPVYAQSDGEETIEEIITTGSRIARTELESVSPITIVTEEAIEFAGANSIATILNELPSAGVPGSVDTATNFRTTTTGLNTIDSTVVATSAAARVRRP